MSSTENTGDRTQQAAPAPDERPETGLAEVAPVDPTPLAATPDAVVPEVVEPGVDEPAGGAPEAAVSEVAADAPSVTATAPVDEGPLAATPDAAVPEPAEAGTEVPASQAVTPEAGTPATGSPTDAALADPTAAPATPDVLITDTPATDTPATDTPSTDTPPAAEAPAAEAPAAEAPAAAPVPSPGGRHAAGSSSSAETPTIVPAVPASDPTAWGRVDDEGTVFVTTAAGERAVGSWQAGDPAAGLAHYGRRYDDLATEVSLLEARLAAHTGNPGEIKAKAEELADQILTSAAVGDLDHLALRARAISSMAETAVAANRAEKAKARAGQIARKEALAAEAEQIAADSTQWKAAGDRLKAIVEEWKTIKGIDRKTDEALWHRFAAARDAFGRRRGAHFAQLDTQRAEARAAKSELIAEAERLSSSTEWGPTSAAMRSLMDRWKAVPRVGRDTDDDLWKKFRAAQDVFFAARTASDQARSSDELANQKQKEELLAEAEALDPGNRAAQNALRKIQERYDAIGHVPRNAMRPLEDRMRAVEEKFRGVAESTRPRVQPENPLLTSMRAAVTKAEDQLAKAQAAGNAKRISEAEANLATRREWLAEAEKSSSRR
ncbi:conserved protein of unknown function [Modestobacter italicus]|uniref:DUF349 domain-containing protein n=1 Tax=Modestobacter italicus (strain DSM 44449 / CECT 9708 / BC 501) TaxID=2732864 RepID=I4F229_MODI5|nr:DUF349 domain-containing protein [Modestobacter marinus]CCH89692.1 conserved protein of unknown function [Modestobacter marinus]